MDAQSPQSLHGFGHVETSTLWNRLECAEYLGISYQTLARWRRRGYGPPALKLGGALRYEPAAVKKWVTGEARNPGIAPE